MCWWPKHFRGNSRRLFPPIVPLLLLAGCHPEHHQSALHAAGPASASIATLWWFLFAVCTAVFVIVIALVAVAITRRTTGETAPLGNRFIIISGIVLPGIVLVVMMLYSLEATVALRMPETRITVRVVGHQWWWEVNYPDHHIITANEIHIPIGEPVRLELRAADVVHSFWVPNLTAKMDMLPEHATFFWMQAGEPGIYRGQCAEYCGMQHAWMALKVVALEPEAFEQWVAAKQRPHPEPVAPELRRGLEVFFDAGCHACHAIRGTEAKARSGPDLTHIGSRLTIGAALMPNSPGALAGWIANPQALKPGNLMPPTHVSSEDLHALRLYLQSLE